MRGAVNPKEHTMKKKKKSNVNNGRVHMSIALEEGIYAAVRARATAESRTVTAQVRHILKCYLEHQNTEAFAPGVGFPISES